MKFIWKKRILYQRAAIITLFVLGSYSHGGAQTAIGRSTNIEASLNHGGSNEYLLRLVRGESAEIVVHQQGVDVVVELRTPDGKLFASIDSPTGRNGDEVIEIIAQESGTYGLRVRPFDSSEPTGSYRLEVKTIRDAYEEKL